MTRRRAPGTRRSHVLAVLIALAVSACGDVQGGEVRPSGSDSTAGNDQGPGLGTPLSHEGGALQVSGTSADLEASRRTAITEAAARVSPAVVSIHVLRTELAQARTPWESFFLPWGAERRTTGLGSGLIVDPSGIILTNHHVVERAQRILVTLPDGRDLEARLVGDDAVTDLAVLRVDAEGLPTAPIGTARDLGIGEWAIAIGNPFGNFISNPEPTVTAGVVSAIGRHIVPSGRERSFFLGMIQTDASVNPGNSGGPLVNADGEVIGINTFIFSRGGGAEGLSFAIPVDRALRIAEDLLEHGEVRRPWIGVDVAPFDADDFGRTRGVRAARVAPESPASRAGIREGERFLEANGRRLATPLDFEAILLDLSVGDPLELEVEGRNEPVRLIAEALPSLVAERVRVGEELELITVTPQIRAERSIRSEAGALVIRISSRLQRELGLQEGDVLLQLNNQPLTSASDAAGALASLPPGPVRIYFERDRGIAVRDRVLRP